MTNRLAPLVAIAAMPLVAAKGDFDFKGIIGFVIAGAIIGLVARLVVPGSGGMGFLLTIVVGIVGAVLGGWLAGNVFEETAGVDWIASILVAALLVWVVAKGSASRRVV
ncbi:MAG: GlsB/YeaQ/YmgE family stress response membrane protein [Actinomycetota bacterium]